MRLLATAAALALCAPSASRAQPISTPAGAGPETYLEVHLGAYVPRGDQLDTLDPGWDLGGTFGARFNRHVSVEGELSYVHATGETTVSGPTQDGRLELVPITASLRLRLPFRRGELAALGGVGLYLASLEVTSRPVVSDTPATTRSDTAAPFGFHVGASLGFELWRTLVVGAEARRTFVSGTFDGTDVTLDGLRVALTLGWRF